MATLEKQANQVEKQKAARYLMSRADNINKPNLLSSRVYVNCRFSI